MLFLAKRQLLSRKKQTLLILMGILLGSAAYVIISGMMLGFQSYITDQLINNDANIRITAHEELIEKKPMQRLFFGDSALVQWLIPPSGRRDNQQINNPYQWFHRLHNDKRVMAFAPQLSIQALLRKGQLSNAATIIGTDPKQQMRVTNLNDDMTAGSFADLKAGGNHIILGDGLLTKISARVGGDILVAVGNTAPKIFKVVGAFHTGIETIDDTTAYADLSDVQQLNQTPHQVTGIAVRLHDVTRAHEVAAQWGSISADRVQSWDVSNANVMAVFKTQDAVRYFMTVSILLVAAFGIYNVLSVLINQKKREIAILRAMGYTSREIRQLFLYQGIIVGFLGGISGVIIGWLCCHYIESLPLFKDSTGQMVHLKMSYAHSIYIFGIMLALFSALIASILPARGAGKMTPIDIIRESAG